MPEHLALLGSGIDLMLDTFPYNGHTTSCQSIWMGVPMVTRSGDSFRSRVGETIMRNLDLMDFVAADWQQYEHIAISLASDLSRLRSVRPTLRQRMIASPLCDAAAFTRNLEVAYREMVGLTAQPSSG
jgi:predicted O-linked N-acetylglucosamine transferase (SPINDLY family)